MDELRRCEAVRQCEKRGTASPDVAGVSPERVGHCCVVRCPATHFYGFSFPPAMPLTAVQLDSLRSSVSRAVVARSREYARSVRIASADEIHVDASVQGSYEY